MGLRLDVAILGVVRCTPLGTVINSESTKNSCQVLLENNDTCRQDISPYRSIKKIKYTKNSRELQTRENEKIQGARTDSKNAAGKKEKPSCISEYREVQIH